MLNAFRHQRLLRPDARLRPPRSSNCAQRLSASKVTAQALAIQPCHYLPQCSTPFGIKGYCARIAHRKDLTDPVSCSTPFGIKGYCAFRSLTHCVRDPLVLNAFRHQRLLRHTANRLGPLAELVLNAFRHQRLLRRAWPAHRATLRCAQRLSASKVTAHYQPHPVTGSKVCSTPFGIKGYCAGVRARPYCNGSAVLNAFRHQRLLRLRLPGCMRLYCWCSTPFGIKGYCASNISAISLKLISVLNAFRHQRLLRPWKIGAYEPINLCSTPFGIKGYCASVSRWRAATALSAQRLSASKVTALGRSPHRSSNTTGAQRLSASKVTAHKSRYCV